MRTISVVVQDDHLESLSKARDPIAAIAELIWNGLDADADSVEVRLNSNALDELDSINISDNGHGLPYADGLVAFESLGGSLKRRRDRSPAGRKQHGELGKGRFRAFALGGRVEWDTRYRENGSLLGYQIIGRRQSLGRFDFSAPRPSRGEPGTTVTIENIERTYRSLDPTNALVTLARIFALYLRQYRKVRITYDGHLVDPADVEEQTTDHAIAGVTVDDDRQVSATLTIIEWKMPSERGIYLCDEDGFSHGEVEAGIRASGFNFTAYLKSAYIRELADDNTLGLLDLHEGLAALLKAARDRLKAHFRQRSAEAASVLVEAWKQDEVYPYAGSPATAVERVERQVFDILAVNVHSYLPDFDEAGVESKRFTLRLLRGAIESNPQSLRLILDKLFKLPREKQDDFARLLERTSLEAVIAVSKLVADRLEFLAGLQHLVMDPTVKKPVRERSQLHRLVAEHTWIFGEEYNLTGDDEDLTTVLRRMLKEQGKDADLLDPNTPVRRADGRRAVIDLMLSKRVPLPRDEERRHLVIELKRPTVRIDDEAILQIKSYAEAIVNDPRFKGTKTEWVFWAVSTEITDSVRSDANQEGRPSGLLHQPKGKPYTIWVKSWGDIVQENEARLTFLKRQLQYRADAVSGMAYLRDTYEKYLPKAVTEDAASAAGAESGAQVTSEDNPAEVVQD